jgi:cytochrome P450
MTLAEVGFMDFLPWFAVAGKHSDQRLRDVVTNYILAGRDTTSSALTWFFWLVSARTDVEKKIVREIQAARASSGCCETREGAPTTTFSFDELREMHYLHAAVTESMRLYPSVAADTHSCKEDDMLPDGTFAGKGWLVTYCAYCNYKYTLVYQLLENRNKWYFCLDQNGIRLVTMHSIIL